MRPGKIVLLVVGILAALVSLGLALGGGALVWAHATQRDAAGYYKTSTERLETPTYALTSERIDLGADVAQHDWTPFDNIGTARIVARSAQGKAVFVGIARHADVQRFLAASAHDELTRIVFDPFKATYRHQGGEARPTPPGNHPFWVASASGPGTQTVTWDVERGQWDVVVMNADASLGVAVDASVGFKTGWLLPIGIGLLAAGLIGGAVATTLIVVAVRREGQAGPGQLRPEGAPLLDAPPAPVASGASYPLRIEGRLDEPLNRWLWLVKWLLAILHFIVLAFLWVAFAVLTVVAGFAIVFTGRYPRSIFDFNVGVLRWTWRVTFYAFTLGTDRYPPFSLEADPSYPAALDVAYPEQLSRPLVLVKWWLLALPHYLIISVFGGGMMWWAWGWGRAGSTRAAVGGGLIGLLVLVAAVALAFTRRYPRPVFDFVMGMQRWTYRVWAYAALMRDEYPPFRLDNGGADPGTVPASPTPPEPASGDQLVTAGGGPR